MDENLRLELRRVVRAPRSRVFAAWEKPEILMQWFGPGKMLPSEVALEAHVGGEFRFEISGPSPRTGEQMTITFHGTYREFIANERISMNWSVAGDPGPASLVTVEFRDVTEGTEVVLTHEQIPNAELRNRNQFGWSAMLEKLAGVIEGA